MAINADLMVTFNCTSSDNAGIVKMTTDVRGEPLGQTFVVPDLDLTMRISVRGSANVGVVANKNVDYAFYMTTKVFGDVVIEPAEDNWVGWSQIGAASFEITRVNDAGRRPMDWRGVVYQILQLGQNAVVYGSGGITEMVPVAEPAPTFGFIELREVGIRSAGAVAGTRKVHYFIDITGDLWRFNAGKTPEKLGYKEFLASLSNPRMFYNEREGRLFISNATAGYIFSEEALSGGYIGLSGYIDSLGLQHVIGPAGVTVPNMEIATSVIDFNYRGLKDIESLEVSADSADALYVAVDYRYDKTAAFATTGWVKTTIEGFAKVKVSGLEFRLRVKSLVAQSVQVHYILVNLKYGDSRYQRGMKYANTTAA